MMAAQTLDTVPEETVAPAVTTPTPERVTSEVPKTKPATAKHPGRVASGRRQAERNRLAREAKKQAEAQKATAGKTTVASAVQQITQTQVRTQQNNQATTQATLFWG